MTTLPNRRSVIGGGIALATLPVLGSLAAPAIASSEPVRFAVGPFLPTPDDTRKEWEPMFEGISRAIGRPYTMVATSDWAGISIALASAQVDFGFVGPWGYILAKREGNVVPLAVSLVNGSPTYNGIIVARRGLVIDKFPEDAKGLRISFADLGSTTGYLIPAYWFKQQGIDPRTYFDYRDGATHAANEVAVASGQVDLATDNDRNRRIMIERGVITEEDTTIVWTSDPVPNSLMAGRAEADAGLTAALKEALLAVTPAQAAEIMPKNFTGWADTNDSEYTLIEEAGLALGLLKAS